MIYQLNLQRPLDFTELYIEFQFSIWLSSPSFAVFVHSHHSHSILFWLRQSAFRENKL